MQAGHMPCARSWGNSSVCTLHPPNAHAASSHRTHCILPLHTLHPPSAHTVSSQCTLHPPSAHTASSHCTYCILPVRTLRPPSAHTASSPECSLHPPVHELGQRWELAGLQTPHGWDRIPHPSHAEGVPFTRACSAAISGKLERAELGFFKGLEGYSAVSVQGVCHACQGVMGDTVVQGEGLTGWDAGVLHRGSAVPENSCSGVWVTHWSHPGHWSWVLGCCHPPWWELGN